MNRTKRMWLLDNAKIVIDYLARAVEFAAALIIGLASIEATVQALLVFAKRNTPPAAKNEVRLTLGRWLAVGLEFELAADILRTAITPTWVDIEMLAAIAALRTGLNYFLGKEIEQESKAQRREDEEQIAEQNPASHP